MIRQDLLMHFLVGFFIYILSVQLIPELYALILTVVAGISKEVYDYFGNGTTDWKDILFTGLPALLMYFLL